jgi:hypothetical protein
MTISPTQARAPGTIASTDWSRVRVTYPQRGNGTLVAPATG